MEKELVEALKAFEEDLRENMAEVDENILKALEEDFWDLTVEIDDNDNEED